MIGEIKEVKIGGKTYEIKKGGVNVALTAQSIFLELISNSKLDRDKDLKESEIEIGLMIAMRGKVLDDIKSLIMSCVGIKSDKYDNLEPNTVTQLFMEVYNFHTQSADKKKEKQQES